MTNSPILPTANEAWGFWGTMGADATAAWPLAFAAIQEATGEDADAVRAFLDSRHGRHFADDVQGFQTTLYLKDAVPAAVARWMGWTISRATSRDTGIPHGMPYLTGFVVNEGFAAEAAA